MLIAVLLQLAERCAVDHATGTMKLDAWDSITTSVANGR